MLRCLRSHQDRASGHFFSDALRLRWAREVGGMNRRPYLSACCNHSTPWLSGSLVAFLAQQSAVSLPGMLLCAGHNNQFNALLSGSRATISSEISCFLVQKEHDSLAPESPKKRSAQHLLPTMPLPSRGQTTISFYCWQRTARSPIIKTQVRPPFEFVGSRCIQFCRVWTYQVALLLFKPRLQKQRGKSNQGHSPRLSLCM